MLQREHLGRAQTCVLAEASERFHTCSFHSKIFITCIDFVCRAVGACHSVCGSEDGLQEMGLFYLVGPEDHMQVAGLAANIFTH